MIDTLETDLDDAGVFMHTYKYVTYMNLCMFICMNMHMYIHIFIRNIDIYV